MPKLLIILFLLFMLPYPAESQILPKEGIVLHYRIIGFSIAPVLQSGNYKIEIAAGNYYSEDSFKKNIIQSHTSKNNKIIAEVPSFGSQYTWRMVAEKGNSLNGEFHHFSTGMIPFADTNNVRFRITQPAVKYKDAYVFLDGNRTLYDMNGRPVWYLPDLNGINDGNGVLCDMKLSASGTITFLLNTQAYEINYNGDILWKGPNTGEVSGDSVEHYHHEFTKLTNGHYMVMGSELTTLDPVPAGDKTTQGFAQKLPLGTIIEYDKKGNVVWSWKSAPYFRGSDIRNYRRPNMDVTIKIIVDPHENGFFFDEKDHNIYISCKNISRVLKVKYPEGKVINSYGETYKPGVKAQDNGLFCHQHSCRHSQKGYLFLFNNNTCLLKPNAPKITMMQEPLTEKDHLKKIWEYDFAAEGNYPPEMSGGGNVTELPDQSIFVCMGNQYSATMIISMDKKILWSGLPERWKPEENRWEKAPQYHASIIASRKELEQLIWNTESK